MSPYDLRQRSEHFITARKWTMSIMCGTFGFGFFLSEANRIQQLPLEIANIAYLTLLFITGILIFLWIWASQKELDILFEWMDPKSYEPPSDLKETATIVGLGMLLVAMVFVARYPVVFGSVFTVYAAANMLATIHMNKELREIFSQTREHLGLQADGAISTASKAVDLRLSGVSILEEYFISRPHTLRHITIFVVSVAGLITAIFAHRTEQQVLRNASYVIFVAMIVVSEIVIGHWRNVRDTKLRKMTSQLNEIRKSQRKTKVKRVGTQDHH